MFSQKSFNTSNQNPNPETALMDIFRSMLHAAELPHDIGQFFREAKDATDLTPGEISVLVSTCPPPGDGDYEPLYLRVVEEGAKVPRIMTSRDPFKAPQHILIRTDLKVSSKQEPISILDVIQVNSDVIDPGIEYPRFRFIKSKTRPAVPQMFRTISQPLEDLANVGREAVQKMSDDVSEMKTEFIQSNQFVQSAVDKFHSSVSSIQESIQTAITKMMEMISDAASGATTALSITGAVSGLLYLANSWYEDFKLRVTSEPNVGKARFLKDKAIDTIKTLLKCGVATMVAAVVLMPISKTVRNLAKEIAAAVTDFAVRFATRTRETFMGFGNKLADHIFPVKPLSTWKLTEQISGLKLTYTLDETTNRSDKVHRDNLDWLKRYVINAQTIIGCLIDEGKSHPLRPKVHDDQPGEFSNSIVGRTIYSYMFNGHTYAATGNNVRVQGGFMLKHSLNPAKVTVSNLDKGQLKFLRDYFLPSNKTSAVITRYRKYLYSLRRLTLAITDLSGATDSIYDYMELSKKDHQTYLDIGLIPYADEKNFPHVDFEALPQSIEEESDEESDSYEDVEANSDTENFFASNLFDYQNWNNAEPLSTSELEKVRAATREDSKVEQTLPMPTTESDVNDQTQYPPADGQMGKDHGLNSFLALIYALFQYYANPSIPISEHLAKLRTNSMSIGVGMTAASFMTKVIPNDLRYAAFSKLGFGAPPNLTSKQKALITNAFLISAHLRNEANRTVPNKREFELIHQHLLTEIAKHSSSWSPAVRTFFNTAKSDMLSTLSIVESIADEAPIKPVPVGLWLWGSAGSGKTTMISNIAKLLFSHVYPADRVWAYNDANQYWDGYHGQSIVLFDDVGSDPKATAENHTFAQLLTHMSSATSTVAGADVSTKKVPFRSDIVALTSNISPDALLRQISDQGRLTNPSAILRRFNNSTGITVEVVLEQEYKIRGADGKWIGNSAAIAAAARRDPMSTPWCKYRLPNGTILEFQELFELVVTQMTRSKIIYGEMSTNLNNTAPEDFACVRGLNAINAIVNAPKDLLFTRSSPADFQMPRRSKKSFEERKTRLTLKAQWKSALADWHITQKKLVMAGRQSSTIDVFREKSVHNISISFSGADEENQFRALEAAIREYLEESAATLSPNDMKQMASMTPREGDLKSQDLLALTTYLGLVTGYFDELKRTGNFDDDVLQAYREEFTAAALVVAEPPEFDEKMKQTIKEELVRRNVDENHPVSLFTWCYTKFEQCAVRNWEEVKTHFDRVVAAKTNIDWISAAKVLAGVVAAAGVLFAAWRMFSADTTVFQSRDPGKKEVKEPHARSDFTNQPTRSFHQGRAVAGRSQMSNSFVPASNQEAITRIKKNMIQFSPHAVFDERHYGSALVIYGRTVLMQAHYIESLTPGNDLEATIRCVGHSGHVTYSTVVRYSDITVLSNFGHRGDMILWDIPTNMGYKVPGPKKSIINLFVSEDELSAHSNIFASNFDVDGDSKRHKVITRFNSDFTIETIDRARITSTPVTQTPWLGVTGIERVMALIYERDSRDGDCGSVTLYNGKIIGIHTAGYGRKWEESGAHYRSISVSNVVTEEILTELQCSTVQCAEKEQSSLIKCFSCEQNDGALHPNITYGRVPDSAEALGNVRTGSGPRATKITRTRMLAAGSKMAAKCKVEPTQLSHLDMPEDMGFKNYADFLVYIHNRKNKKACDLLYPPLLKECFHRLVGRVMPLPEQGKDPKRVWSVFEALNPSLGGYPLSHLSLSTSAGYGSVGNGKNSYIYFDHDDQVYRPYAILEELIDRQLAKIDDYQLPFQPFVVSPKDECRPKAKLTRIIDGATIDMTILARMGFWQFLVAWHNDPIAYGHVVGLAVNQGHDWSAMVSTLHDMSPVGFGGDIRSFDGLFSQQAWIILSECIEQWYKDHDLWTLRGAKIRTAILMNTCHSTHVAGDRLYRFDEHMPSGSPLTTVANTLWSAVLLMYSYACLAPDRKVPGTYYDETRNGTLYNFENFVINFACGDDNITAVKDVIGDWYNARCVAEFLETIGVQYTPPEKDQPHPIKNLPIVDIEFLSCRSVPSKVPGVVFSPRFNDKCLTKSFMWVKENKLMSQAEAVAANLNMVLQRAFWSGKERMDEIHKDVVSNFARAYPGYTIPRPFDTYESTMLDMGLGRVEEWEAANHQMMATGVPSATSIVDKEPVTMTAGGGSSTPMDLITRTPQNVITPCRRTHPFHVFKSTADYSKTFDVAALFGCWWKTSGEFPGMNYTMIHKVATFFRCWGGSPNIVLYLQQGSGDIAFKPFDHTSNVASFYDAQNGTAAAGNTATCYPTAVGERDCWGVSGTITQQTRFNCFKIKHFQSDVLEECSPGSVGMNVTGSPSGAFAYNFGDGTDLAVPLAVPLIIVGKNVSPDEYNPVAERQMIDPLNIDLDNDEYEPAEFQGISYSSTNIKNVQSEGIVNSPRNDFENDVDADVHANDAPNQFVSLGAVLKQPAQYPASATRFDTNPALAITPGIVPANMRSVASSSDTSIRSVAKMTVAEVVELKSSFPQGYVLWSSLITPTRSIMPLLAPGDLVQPTALGAVSAMYGLWRGGIELSIQAVMSGTHTCRLGVAVLFGKYSVPTGGITQLTSQRLFTFELSGENRTGTVDIPYVSTTPLMHTWRGQNQSNPDTYATGIVVVFVLNSLRGPEAASNSIDLVISEGPGKDFQLLSPGNVNQSLRYFLEDGKAPGPGVEDFEVAEPQMMQPQDSKVPSEDASITTTESKGVAFAESSQIVQSGVQSGSSTVADQGGYIAMPTFSAVDMLMREQLIHTGSWSTTDAESTPLWSASVPNGLFAFVAQKAVDMYQYYRMKTHITIKVQATAFHSGRLIGFHVPMTSETDVNRVFLGIGSAYPGVERRTNQSYTDHVFLDVSTSASSELVIPFRFLKPYIQEFEEQSRFVLSVFTPLRVGTGGATTIPYSVIVSFSDVSMKVLNPY